MGGKNGLLGLIVLLALVVGAFVWFGDVSDVVPLETYRSTDLGIAFEYPPEYTLQTHHEGTAERAWTTLTLIDSKALQSATDNGASEGPPAIAIQVFSNPEQYSVEQWIRGVSYSNYKLSSDETLTPATVAGESGLTYRYSGLFETNVVVVAHDASMYMLSVDWLTSDDQNVKDFQTLLEHVQFI